MKIKIRQMIKELGGNRAAIAKGAGISEQQLNNMVSHDASVFKLADGSYTQARKNAAIFGDFAKGLKRGLNHE